MAPDTSRNELHFAKAQKSMLIKWSFVLKRLICLSYWFFLTELLIISSLIKEISCPKTDFVEKQLVLPIVGLFVW